MWSKNILKELIISHLADGNSPFGQKQAVYLVETISELFDAYAPYAFDKKEGPSEVANFNLPAEISFLNQVYERFKPFGDKKIPFSDMRDIIVGASIVAIKIEEFDINTVDLTYPP